VVRLRDITRRREAEQDRDRFFNLTPDLLCVAGTDGLFKRVNDAFPAVLGHPREVLLSRPFLEFVHPEDRESTLAASAGLARGEAAVEFENRYLCADGSVKWLSWNAA
jgi:PAS domain S-box-containing protein